MRHVLHRGVRKPLVGGALVPCRGVAALRHHLAQHATQAIAAARPLHGAGIGPGAATELFPLLLSVMSTGVTFVRAEEFSDLRTYGAPDVLLGDRFAGIDHNQREESGGSGHRGSPAGVTGRSARMHRTCSEPNLRPPRGRRV